MNDSSSTVWRRLGWWLEAASYDLASFLLRSLPLDSASALGGAVVGLLGPLTSKQAIVLRNLELAFPELGPSERRRIAAAFWNGLGRTVAEFPLMDRLMSGNGRVEVVGMERLKHIASDGQPVVLVSGHLANWEVMVAVIAASDPKCRFSYRPSNNPYVDRRITDNRRRFGVELFAPKGGDGTREMLSALRRGEAVALLNDQRDNAGIEAPFFGDVVRTAPGPARFAQKSGGRLVPMSVERLKGARFRVTVHEPIAIESSGDRAQDLKVAVTRINAFVEARIRARPEQWLWAHRRWPLERYAGSRGGGRAQRLDEDAAAVISSSP